jgi:hypothetical protein
VLLFQEKSQTTVKKGTEIDEEEDFDKLIQWTLCMDLCNSDDRLLWENKPKQQPIARTEVS